jgi:hypothetical protein
VFLPATTGQLLYIATGEEWLVAREKPTTEGEYESAEWGDIIEVESGVRDEAPGKGQAITMMGLGIAGAVAEVVALGPLTTPWVSLPLGVAIAAYASIRYRRRRLRLAEEWQRNHIVLAHREEWESFAQALSAAKEIVDLWPHVSGLVGVADPSPALAQSLWELAEVLARRAPTRISRKELRQSRIDLPADVRVRREVDDYLGQIEELLSKLNFEVTSRIQSIRLIADECRRFIQEQQAIAQARNAVRRADQTLGSIVSPPNSPDNSDDLSSRTRSILAAYRDLTRDLGTEEALGS